MTKKSLNLFLLACMLTCVCVFTGCQDKDYYDPEWIEENGVGINPSLLDFSTSQEVRFDFNYEVAKGFVSTFDIYTEYPLTTNGLLKEGLTPLASGINVAGTSVIKRMIPAYVKEVYAYSPNLFVPLLSYAKVENGVASFEQVDVVIPESRNSTRAVGNAVGLGKKPISKFLKTIDDFYAETAGGNYKYDLINPDEYIPLPVEVATSIGKAFPESKIAKEIFYQDATIKIQKGQEGKNTAEVFVSVIFGGGSYNSAFSYFVYEGSKELADLSEEEINKLEIINIFQYADVNTNKLSGKKDKGLTPGKYVQLLYKNKEGDYVTEFPVGAQIGWVLHPSAFDEKNFTVDDKGWAPRLFSVSAWNAANNKTAIEGVKTNNYNIFFSTTADNGDVYNCLGFEDNPLTTADGDCNDLLFHILTNPIDAIETPPAIEEEDIEITETKKGILTFEDNWPKRGDYDLNDVVVKYTSDITYQQTIKKDLVSGTTVEKSPVMVKKVEDFISLLHTGAHNNNAFSYKVDIAPNAVKSILVTNKRTNETTDYTKLIIADGNGFIIDLCANVKDVIEAYVYDTPAQDYTIVMEFNDSAVLQEDFTALAAPYNPFIAPAEYPGVEIHLPMYTPTSKNVNMDLFGTQDDRSDKNKLWYVSGTKNLYPFALHLAGVDAFDIPEEGKEISASYPRYTNWVESGMTEDLDWYVK